VLYILVKGTADFDSKDIKFIEGKANSEGWGGSSNNGNTGTGKIGTCCNEMDIWEASLSTPEVLRISG